MKFGENLYNLRKSAKMSQEKLAEEVGVSRQSVSKWENGESYPEMENILKLCKIFHCKINDLVHDDLQDIDSLDEDVKMSVVKFEKEKQKKLKVISKIIYIIAKIGRIAARIGSICLLVATILGIVVINSINVKSDTEIEVGMGQEVVEFKNVNDEIVVSGTDSNRLDKIEVVDIESKEELRKIIDIFRKNSKASLIAYVIVTMIFMIASLILLEITLRHLEKLFKNIHDGDTPFTLDNVNHIKKMSYFMIAVTIVSTIGNAIGNTIIKEDIDFNIGFGLIYILVMYSIAYIFEYGYQIQLDSKGRIYGDENE